MNIGNWKISAAGIEWAGDSSNRFVVETAQLPETVLLEEGLPAMYKWILLATEEEWLTADDLYDFNHAFIYAAGRSESDFNYETFDQTLSYQYELLDQAEEEQPLMPMDSREAEETADLEQQRKEAFSERD